MAKVVNKVFVRSYSMSGQPKIEWDPTELPIGETIFRMRSSMEISILSLQEMTGIHRNTLSRIERGDGPPNISALLRIAKALNVELWRLMKFAQKATPKGIADHADLSLPEAPIEPFHVAMSKVKNRARYILNRAVYTDKLKREACEVCGDEQTEAHHEDYSKPLDVIWLCRVHHAERHRAIHCTRTANRTAHNAVQ